jgi:hypothetical protein
VGSLYDIGNFRYRHFTFYSCAGESEESTCTDAPANTIDSNGNENDEIINFLDRTWPHKGLFIGDSSEGDYSFVTYVNQTTDKINVQNIYIYKRVRSIDVANSSVVETKYNLVWEQVLEPVDSLKPGITPQL